MGLFSKSDQNKQDVVAEDNGQFSLDGDAEIAAVAKSKRASSAGEAPRRSRKGAAAEADDPMLPEKKRARRRLVGAIALALGVAVGLPMILDSEPKPLATDIAIEIPSKDKVAPLPMPAATAPEVAPDVATVTAGGAAEPDAATAEPVPDQAAQVAPAAKDPAPEAVAAEAAKPADKPVVAKPADKPADKPAAKPRDDERALAILENKPVPARPAAAAAAQKFVVQVGAFSTAQKAADVRARLGKAGIASYTEKMKTGTIRVRVGPFASRAQAEQARAKVDRVGMKGNIVPVSN